MLNADDDFIQHSTFNIQHSSFPFDMTERPPIGKTWNRLYAAVLIFLALQIVVFYAFTKAFE
jgi:hypothetical protein